MKKVIDFLSKNKEWILGICVVLICVNYLLMNYHEKDGFFYESETPVANGNVCILNTSEEVVQYFVCPKDSIGGIKIPINKAAEGEGIVTTEVYKNDVLFYEMSVNVSEINSGQYVLYLFENNMNSVETDIYLLKIRNDSNVTIEVPLTSSYKEDSSLKKQNADFLGQILCTQIIYKSYQITWIIAAIIIAAIIGVVLTIYCIKKRMPLEKVFLVLGGYIGILYFVTLPVFRAPDEINHYMRAFEISQGNLVSQHMGEDGVGGNYLPENTIPAELCEARNIDYYKILENRNQEMNYEQTVAYTFGNTALYAPLVYLPQTVGIIIGSLFTHKSVYLVYAGRLVTFLFCYLLLYFCIKNTVIRKNAVFLSCFMPMLMSQIVSLSADAVTIVTAFALVTFCVKINLDDTVGIIDNKKKIGIAALTLLLSLCKIVYLPVCFIILWLNRDKFKNRKDSILFKTVTLAVVSIVNVIWLIISAGFLVEFNPGVDSKEQVKYVLTHLISYIGICANTFIVRAQGWLEEMVGSKLGWAMDVEVPLILISAILVVLVLFIVIAGEEEEKELSVGGRGVLLLIVLATVALIFTSLYVQWTPVANTLVNGIQGRYFIPLIPIVVTLFTSNNVRCKYNYGLLYMFLFMTNMIAVIKQVFFYL